MEISAECGATATLSMVGTCELAVGRDRSPEGSHWLAEATTRFTWDGDVGYGLTERTVRR